MDCRPMHISGCDEKWFDGKRWMGEKVGEGRDSTLSPVTGQGGWEMLCCSLLPEPISAQGQRWTPGSLMGANVLRVHSIVLRWYWLHCTKFEIPLPIPASCPCFVVSTALMLGGEFGR